MNDNIKTKPEYLSPLRRICMTIGELPTSYLETMTYYEMLLWLIKYLNETVIPAINNNADLLTEVQKALEDLRKYVDDYFENLDLQEEIDNALNEMVESGKLEEIVLEFLQIGAVLGFDTKASLKASTNLVVGSICRTLGDEAFLDGDGHYYRIRELTPEDVIDEDNLLAITNDPTLVAEKIPNYYIDDLYSEIEKINKEYDQDIKIKNYYHMGQNVFITEIRNITETRVCPSNDNATTPNLNCLNVQDYKNLHPEYDILTNGGLANTSTMIPEGYTLFNGTVYTGNTFPANRDFVGFDENNNLMSKKLSEVSSGQDLINAGFKNGVTTWESLIRNGVDIPYVISQGNGLDPVIAQLDDGTIVHAVFYARKPFNNVISYDNIRIFMRSKYPNIREMCVLDGGGSAQIYNQNMSLIPSTDGYAYVGRKVTTIFTYKVRGEV